LKTLTSKRSKLAASLNQSNNLITANIGLPHDQLEFVYDNSGKQCSAMASRLEAQDGHEVWRGYPYSKAVACGS
jgi:hypothetical protein